jgi:hypothetical protein
MSNASLTEAYRILREITGGQEPYASVVPALARELEAYRERTLIVAMVPFQNLLSTLADMSRGAATAEQEQINAFSRVIAGAIEEAQALSTREPAELSKET